MSYLKGMLKTLEDLDKPQYPYLELWHVLSLCYLLTMFLVFWLLSFNNYIIVTIVYLCMLGSDVVWCYSLLIPILIQ